MKIPLHICEEEGIEQYLRSRNILSQYQKAKQKILSGYGQTANFGQREPKGNNIRYFRINKQFRARCSFDSDDDLIVFKIDDHS